MTNSDNIRIQKSKYKQSQQDHHNGFTVNGDMTEIAKRPVSAGVIE